jgi:hypothetical protein
VLARHVGARRPLELLELLVFRLSYHDQSLHVPLPFVTILLTFSMAVVRWALQDGALMQRMLSARMQSARMQSANTLCLGTIHECIMTCEAHVAPALSANAQHGACAPPAYTLAVHVPALKASHVTALKASHVKALKASHVTKA